MSQRTASPNERFRRPDASMSLLNDIMAESLDAGYAEATARRAVRGQTGLHTGVGARLLAGLGVALIAVILTVAAVQLREQAPQLEKQRQELIDRVHIREDRADKLGGEVDALRREVDDIQKQEIPKALADKVKQLGVLSGTDAVTGQGLRVTADDAKATADGKDSTDPRRQKDAATGRLVDRDLQRLVNGLWKAGAEAIAVNGQRLTPLSAIRAAGLAILVDNRPQSPPYVVQAIGDGKRMQVDFQDGADGRYLHLLQERYGIRITLAVQKKISLPAAAAVSLHWAKAQGTAPPTPPPASAGPSQSASTPPSPGKSGRPSKSSSPTPGRSTSGSPTKTDKDGPA